MKRDMRDGTQLHSWFSSFPQESIERLRAINASTASSKHVILALGFGLFDMRIRKLNCMIVALLVSRLKAERSGNSHLVGRINKFMEEVHAGIDAATGFDGAGRKNASPCNRPARAAS